MSLQHHSCLAMVQSLEHHTKNHYFTLPDLSHVAFFFFDLQAHCRLIQGPWFGVKRACHYSVVWQNSLPKGTVITSLSSFQLTLAKGIIGNHPCNAVPLSFWQLSETTALWFCCLDVKSELNTPSVPQTQHAVFYVCFLTGIYSAGFSFYKNIK